MNSPSGANPTTNGTVEAEHTPGASGPTIGESLRHIAHKGVDRACDMAGQAVDAGANLVSHAGATLRELGQTAVDAVLNFPKSTPPNLKEWSKVADAGAEPFSEAAFRYFLQFADTLGLDSVPRVTFGADAKEFVFGLMPFLGPSKEIGVARMHYREACETNDELLKKVARRECLYACANLGLDATSIASLGLSGSTAKLAKLFAGLTVLKAVAFVSYSNDSHLARAADKLLTVPFFGVVIDQILTMSSKTTENEAKPSTATI